MADQDIQSNVVLTADTSQYSQQFTAAGQQADSLSSSIDTLAQKLDKLSKTAGRKLIGVGAVDTAAIGGTTAAYAAWEKQMTSLNVQAAVLNRTMNDQKRTFGEYGRQVNSLRRDFGQSTQEAAQLVQTISKMSDNTQSVTQLERSFGKLGSAMGESSSSLAASMLQLQRTMGTSQRDTNMFNNQLVTLQSRSNAAASSILGFANSIAPVARMANISQTDIMGMSNAFIKAGQDGYQAANVVTRMLTDITQATVSGSPELAKYANLVGMTTQQFKELGGTGQITQIFDAINRQGPQAITTLNRMGLDGLRTVRTISAMAQQGGLAGEIAAARGADGGALDRGSSAAMSGIVDSMKKMRIELTQTAEDFGKVIAGPAKLFFESMTMIAKGVHMVVDSPLGKMAAWASLAVAPIAALTGALLLGAKALSTYAAANYLLRGGLLSGIREGRGISMARQEAMLAGGTAMGPMGRNVAEHGSWTNRMMYNTGARLGSYLPGRGPGPGLGNMAFGTSAAALGGASRLAGQILYGSGAVLVPGLRGSGGWGDISRRPNLFQAQTLRESFGGMRTNARDLMNIRGGGFMSAVQSGYLARSIFGQGMDVRPAGYGGAEAGGVQSAEANPRVAQAQRIQAERLHQQAMANETAQRTRSVEGMGRFNRMTFTASEGLGRFTRGMGSLIGMVGATGVGATRDLASGLKGASSALGLNGPMLGIMAGIAGAAAIKTIVAAQNIQTRDTAGFNNQYYSAAGISAPPTAQTNYTRSAPAANTIGDALSVAPRDVNFAQSSGHKLSNSMLKGLSRTDAMARLATQWPALRQSPAAVQQIKLDLIDKFGSGAAQNMLTQLDSGSGPALQTLAGQAGDANSAKWKIFPTGKAAASKLDQFYGGLSDQTDYLTSATTPQNAQMARLHTLEQGYAAFAKGRTSQSQKKAWEVEFNKNVLGLNNVNYAESKTLFGSPFDFGGTNYTAGGQNKTLRESLIASATSGALSNAHNRADVAEKYGIDHTKNMTPTQFADAFIKAYGTTPGGKATESRDKTTQELLQGATKAMFGVAGVLGNRTVQTALHEGSGDVNAQYAAINTLLQKTSGLGRRGQFGALYNMQQIAGGDPSMGSQYIGGALQIAQRNMQYQMPYMTRTQQFGANVAQTGAMLNTVQQHGFSAGLTQENLDTQMGQFQQGVQEQYNYFKQMLYQQREFNVSRKRGEDDFNLQRSYAQTDFNLQRGRAESDFQLQRRRAEDDYQLSVSRNRYQFNLQRSREEQDHQHQVMLMVEQQAKAMYNMYERTKVQQTNSASWLLVNSQDQLARMQKQSQQLDQLRKMGLGDDAIQQLGLTDSNNAQQLSRFVGEVSADPNMIKAFNDAVKKRLGAARDLVTDESSTDWQEFQRSYNLARSRASDDFELSMKQSHADFKKSLSRQDTDFQTSLHRQQHDFSVSMDRQQTQYNTTMQRAADDLARSAKTIDGNFEDILTLAVKRLGGHAGKQAKTVLDQFSTLKSNTQDASIDIMTTLAAIFGVDWAPPKAKAITAQSAKNQSALADIHGFSAATGGVLPGYTPGRDVHHFTSPTAGALALSGGEAIMVPEWTRAVGGPKAVAAMNKSARYGQAYASGGVIPQERLNQAKSFAKAQVGDPYVWGGVGPSGYDCSGFMSALTNVLMGNSPYHRYGSTASFPWPGFKPGPGQFTIGSTKHYPGSSVGHMAGTLDGMNVESRGGRGVLTGSAARGYRDPGFSTIAHLGTGGDFGYNGTSDNGHIPGLREILKNYYKGAEVAAAGLVPHPLQGGDISRIINTAAKARYRKLKAAGQIGNPDSSSGSMPINPGDSTSPEADVRIAAAHYGWMPQQWRSLSTLINHESGFNPRAQNPTSTAYGMFQFLDSTWASVGGTKTSDPMLQAIYGTKYIKNRYGNPNKAWDFWQQHHWYGDGAVFSGAQTIGVGERGPEAVIPLNDRGADFMSTLMSKYGSGLEGRGVNVRGSQPIYVSNNNTYHVDKSTTFTGPISVQADNPGQLIAALQQRQRVMALANPAMGGVKV